MSRSGFYGKLSSHGDFISRRLSPTFVRTWDSWLQDVMVSSRESLGEDWRGAYLCSPIWRFALASGVCGELAWAGVLMPSVDRVGRYFPLTLAHGCAPVSPLQRLTTDSQWYEQLEGLALSSLEAGFCLAAFDNALMNIPEPSRGHSPLIEHRRNPALAEYWLELPEGLSGDSLLQSPVLPDVSTQALFWTDGTLGIPRSLLVSSRLPSHLRFADMLSGRRPVT